MRQMKAEIFFFFSFFVRDIIKREGGGGGAQVDGEASKKMETML